MSDEHLHHTKTEFVEGLVHHDEWFRHGSGDPHHQEAHGSTRTRAILAFLAFTVVFVIVVGALVFSFFESQARILKSSINEASTPREEYVGSMTRWESELSTYGWVAQEGGAVRLPLDEAIERVVVQYRTQGD